MTTNKINSQFLRFGLINLIFSILFFLLAGEIGIEERIFGMFVINAGYLMFYFFIGQIPLLQLKWLKKHNSPYIYSIQKKMIRWFSTALYVFALLAFLILIITSFSRNELYILCAVFVPFGIYLGTKRLRIGLDKLD